MDTKHPCPCESCLELNLQSNYALITLLFSLISVPSPYTFVLLTKTLYLDLQLDNGLRIGVTQKKTHRSFLDQKKVHKTLRMYLLYFRPTNYGLQISKYLSFWSFEMDELGLSQRSLLPLWQENHPGI